MIWRIRMFALAIKTTITHIRKNGLQTSAQEIDCAVLIQMIRDQRYSDETIKRLLFWFVVSHPTPQLKMLTKYSLDTERPHLKPYFYDEITEF